MQGPRVVRLASLMCCLICGCQPVDGELGRTTSAVTIRGSDTMVILTQKWAEAFMDGRPSISIQVSGGGSGTGIAALVNGTADIATASRAIRQREIDQIHDVHHEDVHVFRAAIDAVAVYVHRDNPVVSLRIDQVEAIFRGQLTDWRHVGGPDRPFVLYSRENNSGTYAFFKEEVLQRFDFAAEAQSLPGTAAVIHAVANDLGGIGYGGIGYGSGVRTLALVPGQETRGVVPSPQAATDGTYPLARYLFLITVGAPTPAATEFLQHLLSPEGQHVVVEAGFYPLPEAVVNEERERLARE